MVCVCVCERERERERVEGGGEREKWECEASMYMMVKFNDYKKNYLQLSFCVQPFPSIAHS